MNVAMVVVSDGRLDYLQRCLASLAENVAYPFLCRRLVDDSGGPLDADLRTLVEGFEVVVHPQRRGLAAAVRSGWADLPADVDFVFHVEQDFVFEEPVEIDGMAGILGRNSNLAQVVLKRQPAASEVEAGGIIEMHPDEYFDRPGWVEHKRIFSLNPCLVPREVTDMGWPDGNEAEQTAWLLDLGYVFGFFGGRGDAPRVTHIGERRAAAWAP